jgi:peptidyl-prolyl cis-trans isomerase SurA
MSYKTFVRPLLAVVVLVAAFAAGTRAEILEQILVKVNGEIFTKSDLENRQVGVLRQKGQQFDPKTVSNQQLRQMLDEITPRLMVEAVDEMLMVQRGKELGYVLPEEQFKTIVDNIKKENKLESEEQFNAALKSEGLTMADLRRNLERQMLMQKVQQNEVLGKVGVSDEEAQEYYKAHPDEFTTPPTISLREILVAVPPDPRGVNVALDDAALDKATAIRSRVVAGESFEQVAAKVSDSPSKANGGLIGPISLADLTPELRKYIEPLNVGGVTEPLRSERGYVIYKLESSTPTQIMPFDHARDQIGDRVFTAKRKEHLQKYLEKLRGQAIIEWKNQDLKKAYEQGLKQVASELAS